MMQHVYCPIVFIVVSLKILRAKQDLSETWHLQFFSCSFKSYPLESHTERYLWFEIKPALQSKWFQIILSLGNLFDTSKISIKPNLIVKKKKKPCLYVGILPMYILEIQFLQNSFFQTSDIL